MRKLDTLSDTLLAYKYNVNKFCNYGLKTLLTLADVGGDDFQSFEKSYDTLKATPNSKFNNVLIVWKLVLDQTQRKMEVFELLIKAREKYRGMYALKTWHTPMKETPRKLQSDREIVASLANTDAQKEQIEALTAALKSDNPKRGCLSLHGNEKPPKYTAKHVWKYQYEMERILTPKVIMTWLNKPPTGGKYVCKKTTLHGTGVKNVYAGHHTIVQIILDPLQEDILRTLM